MGNAPALSKCSWNLWESIVGTRGSVVFVVDGKEKVTYNQFDSYPDGLGADVLEWLHGRLSSPSGLPGLVAQARELTPVNDGETPSPEEVARFAHLRDPKVSAGNDWYAVLRHSQGRPEAILSAGVYVDAADFPFDSLFCEWAYVIDLDAEVLEVYSGFQLEESKVEGRWAGRVPVREEQFAHRDPERRYAPVSLAASWKFSDLPARESFFASLDEEDEQS